MEQQFVTQLGSQVYTARTAQGLTQSMLATRAGVSERLIRYLEKGQAQSVQLNKLLAILSALGLDLSICTQREAGLYVSGESEQCASDKSEQRALDKTEQHALDKSEQRASNEMKQHTSAKLGHRPLDETEHRALGEMEQRALGETEHRAPQKPSLYESTVDDQEYEALLQKAVSSWLDEAVMTHEG